jgi:phage terminase small subunit
MISQKHKRFCDEYIIDLNGKQAAIRAGYSPKRAEVTASEILAKENVKEYIQQRRKVLQKGLEITQERVLNEYARIAFFDIRKVYTDKNSLKAVKDFDDDSAAVVAGIEVFEEFSGYGESREHIGNTMKVKLHNKVAALDALGKHLGLFQKDNEQSKPDVVPMTEQQVEKIISSLKSLK